MHSNVLVSYRHGVTVVVKVSRVVDVTKVAENTLGVTMATVAKDIIFNKGLGLQLLFGPALI